MLPGQPVPDDVLVRYLLGELPDDEAERLDEQSVVDDDFAARLRLVEDDLVDAYASGRLTGERRKRFEVHYLASPRRREKSSFARQLQAAIDDDLTHRQPPAPAHDRRPAAHWWAWAAAAALVLCLGSSWLYVQDSRLRAALTDTQRRLADADRHTAALATELAVQQRAAAAAQASLAQPPDTQSVTAIALVLLPLTRGASPPPPIIAVGADSRTLPIALAVERPDRAPFEAALRDPATNAIVWRGRAIAAAHAQPPLVTVAVPAGLLKAQHYAIDLFAGGRSAADFAGSYAFEVVRQ